MQVSLMPLWLRYNSSIKINLKLTSTSSGAKAWCGQFQALCRLHTPVANAAPQLRATCHLFLSLATPLIARNVVIRIPICIALPSRAAIASWTRTDWRAFANQQLEWLDIVAKLGDSEQHKIVDVSHARCTLLGNCFTFHEPCGIVDCCHFSRNLRGSALGYTMTVVTADFVVDWDQRQAMT